MHEISRPGVGYAGNDSCPEISLCANITRPTLFEKVSNVTLAWKEQAEEQAEEEDRDLSGGTYVIDRLRDMRSRAQVAVSPATVPL